MHTDEAVHGIKFGNLLEDGQYRYNKNEYHGPTLNYFTLPVAWLKSRSSINEMDAASLRKVPAFFGMVLLLLPLLLIKRLGWSNVLAICLLFALSPIMVYYSRYYIQEILLVCFTFGAIIAGFHFIRTQKTAWIFLFGILIGLMHATKETFIINLGMMLAAFLITLLLRFSSIEEIRASLKKIKQRDVMVMLIGAVMVSITFYSSFFSNWQGIIDSFTTYKTYFDRAGEPVTHLHPWYYYFNLLLYKKGAEGMIWTEVWIVLLSLVGIFALFQRKEKIRLSNSRYLLYFICFYTVLTSIVYSLIPYKTPWNLMQFFFGFIVLAGYGMIYLFKRSSKKMIRLLFIVIITIMTGNLGWQSYKLNFGSPAQPSHPYVYAHTSDSLNKVVEKVYQIAEAHPDNKNMYIEVIFPRHGYWPLPWYLRDFPNVGWWNHVDLKNPAAPLIIASEEMEEALIKKLYKVPPPGERHLYIPLFKQTMYLRPGVPVKGYLRKDIWDLYKQSQTRQTANDSESQL